MPKARPVCRCQAPQPRSGAPKAQGLIAALRPQHNLPCRRSRPCHPPTADRRSLSTSAAVPAAPQLQSRISTSLTDVTRTGQRGLPCKISLGHDGPRKTSLRGLNPGISTGQGSPPRPVEVTDEEEAPSSATDLDHRDDQCRLVPESSGDPNAGIAICRTRIKRQRWLGSEQA